MPRFYRISFRLILTACAICLRLFCAAQVNLILHNDSGRDSTRLRQHDLDSIYRNKELPNIRLENKKWSWNRRVYQNMVTHYNYYFNAETKLNAALDKVQRLFHEDYNTLLPLYPYRMSDMYIVKQDLDSVVRKASIGVEIHDMRGNWIPDLYLLIGQAYYFEGSFNNASEAFQFVNVHFAPKDINDFTPVIGSAGYESKSQISVSTPEKSNETLYRLKHHSSRNEAFLWRTRTMIETGDYDQALSLINILKSDPSFPKRLQGELGETEAYYFFSQGQYDKGASPLQAAISGSSDKAQKSRWEFILGQLNENNNHIPMAITHYQQVIELTSDPLMDFYAHLNIATMNIESGNGNVAQNTVELVRMAHKNKYLRYRGIIYYSLASLDLRTGNDSGAIAWLHQSVQDSPEDLPQKTKSYKLLADLYYGRADYRPARIYYDSTYLTMNQLPGFRDSALVSTRRIELKQVVARLETIRGQDSLRRIAALPDSDRKAFLIKLLASQKTALKKEQKEQLKELALQQQEASGGAQGGFGPSTANPFGQPLNSGNGGAPPAWYFYNPSSIASGYTAFHQQWGNRPLADNWRRASALTGIAGTIQPEEQADSLQKAKAAALAISGEALSLAALYAGLPTTPKQMKQSDDSLIGAYYELGSIFYDGLNNIPAAIADYEALRHRFPDNLYQQQVDYMLYLLYGKDNQRGLASEFKNMLLTKYPGSEYSDILQHGHILGEDSIMKGLVTRYYDTTYLDYLGGDYATVIARKQEADRIYAKNFLQGQFDLLGAMATIKTSPDSLGEKALREVIRQHPSGEIKDQASAILDALQHKQQIIDYLTNLQINPETPSPQTSLVVANSPPASSAAIVQAAPPRPVSSLSGSLQQKNLPSSMPANASLGRNGGHLNLSPQARRFQDSLILAAAKTAALNRTTMTDSAALKARADSLAARAALPKPLPSKVVTAYQPGLKDPYFVVMDFQFIDKSLLDKCLQNFAKYNNTRPATDTPAVEVSSFILTQNKVLLIFRLFPSETSALGYFQEISNNARAFIIPDVNPAYYKFFFISRSNFILLNQTKDYEGYLDYFSSHYRH